MNKILRLLGWGTASAAIAAAAAFLVIVQPGGDGVLGRVTTPDGGEYLVEQRCNWNAEPYTVSFYLRQPGGDWGWCYIDHEARRWSDVELSYDAPSDAVMIREQGVCRAVFDRKAGIFRRENGEQWNEVAAPQREQAPSFASR